MRWKRHRQQQPAPVDFVTPAAAATYGREAQIALLLDSAKPLTLLVGDSGIGKSKVLQELWQRTGSDYLAPPTSVGRSPGALQMGILSALEQTAVRNGSNATFTDRLAEVVRDRVESASSAGLRGVSEAVGNRLLEAVAKVVGERGAKELRAVARDLATPNAMVLAHRISSAADQDTLAVICDLASAVSGLLAPRPLVLYLDDLDALHADDFGRLQDLATKIPTGVSVIGAFAAWDPDSRSRVAQLEIAGVPCTPIAGLDLAAVTDWARDSGLSKLQVRSLLLATDGYPFYVKDALDLLAGGRSADEVLATPADARTAQRTRESFAALSPEAKQACMRLSAFEAPLSGPEAASYLRMTPDSWRATEHELRRAAIFLDFEAAWFHAKRRNALWDEVLDDESRQFATGLGVSFVVKQMDDENTLEPRLVLRYLGLVASDPSRWCVSPSMAAALICTPDELAIVGALIELSEGGPSPISTDALLSYARDCFVVTGRGADALEAVVGRSLVYLAEGNGAAVAILTAGDIATLRLLCGRIAQTFGRGAMPGVASTVFESAIRARLGPFVNAQFGIGNPTFSTLARAGMELQRDRDPDVVRIGRHGPNLLVRASHGSRRVYATVAYDDQAERDAAAHRLQGWSTELFDDELRISDVLAQPATPVPSQRFVSAAMRLVGSTTWNASTISGQKSRTSREFMVANEMAMRGAVTLAIRQNTSQNERLAYNLDRPSGIVFKDFGGSEAIYAHIDGIEGARETTLTSAQTAWWNDPLHAFKWEEEVSVQNASVTQTTVRVGAHKSSPLIEEVSRLSSLAQSFNQYQSRIQVRLGDLEQRLIYALELQHLDACLLADAVRPWQQFESPRGVDWFILVNVNEPDERFVPMAHGDVMWVRRKNNTDDVRCHVAVARPTRDANTHELFRSHFGWAPGSEFQHGVGRALSLLPSWLGYASSEVSFTYG
ncbi:ATP-binding protein [Jatrophihabitans sp.]|uniref:ATP-binding protein n=1 Tax=Jatrophihabitans sp. TaxID=1932789 RepID=UPI0030C6DCF9|nr:hypothetical protein [Jatrophihabitans sp.]